MCFTVCFPRLRVNDYHDRENSAVEKKEGQPEYLPPYPGQNSAGFTWHEHDGEKVPEFDPLAPPEYKDVVRTTTAPDMSWTAPDMSCPCGVKGVVHDDCLNPHIETLVKRTLYSTLGNTKSLQ